MYKHTDNARSLRAGCACCSDCVCYNDNCNPVEVDWMLEWAQNNYKYYHDLNCNCHSYKADITLRRPMKQ